MSIRCTGHARRIWRCTFPGPHYATCRVDHYDTSASNPKRTLMSDIQHGKFGSKMPFRSQRNTSPVLKPPSDPAPGTYNPCTVRRRVSKLVTPAIKYEAWKQELDSCDSAHRAAVHRYSAAATGVHIGEAFRARVQQL